MTDSKPIEPGRLGVMLRALHHRDFRIYFFGMLVSLVGTWMQTVAQSWLVYRLTDSPFLLGLTGFAGQAPVFLLAPFGGVLADRHRRHRIVLLTQALSMIQALALAYLTLSNRITVEAVVALALGLGFVNAFDMPARQSYLIELAGKEDLMNAIALNSSMFNATRIIGPAVAGLLVAVVGEGYCFLINGLSFLAVLASLFAIRAGAVVPNRSGESPITDLKECFVYAVNTASIRVLLSMVAVVSVFGLPYSVLMPVFAKQLGGGAGALGFMLGASGVGALAAALTLAGRRRVHGLGRVVGGSALVFGLSLVIFSLSHNLGLSIALAVPAGFSNMLQLSGTNTLLQTIVPDRLRGRVMSLYAMCLMGMLPFGSLLAGATADRIGAEATVVIGGSVCIVGALVFWSRLPGLRRSSSEPLVEFGLTLDRDQPEPRTGDLF